MSYLAILKDLVASESHSATDSRHKPSLKLVVNRSTEQQNANWHPKEQYDNLSVHDGKNLIEIIQWRVRAQESVRRRLAGQVNGMPLSKQDAKVYRKMIDDRCQSFGLSLESQAPDDLSVLSVHRGCALLESSSASVSLPSHRVDLREDVIPTEPTKGSS
jgi:hypothetical protein